MSRGGGGDAAALPLPLLTRHDGRDAVDGGGAPRARRPLDAAAAVGPPRERGRRARQSHHAGLGRRGARRPRPRGRVRPAPTLTRAGSSASPPPPVVTTTTGSGSMPRPNLPWISQLALPPPPPPPLLPPLPWGRRRPPPSPLSRTSTTTSTTHATRQRKRRLLRMSRPPGLLQCRPLV